ncbi:MULTISPECIES: putative glycolipid-binding domain-containing protein [unclassified Nocardia]|uniref:putative glycolipid-binding domain-containing protein n=1 Tax=unclassified Nocardia TaxID=2637762 RepID=UPI0024A97066|nr:MULTISPECIES: putative glycolipid-binding domain-containing protein [unclassified Nocardia]
MRFDHLPRMAAWRHRGAREGFEVVFPRITDSGVLIDGHTTAVEEGRGWSVDYSIELDGHWRTRAARVSVRDEKGWRTVRLAADGAGCWTVDGEPAPALDGCVDIDLEASACTNTFPVHRLPLAAGVDTAAPAAYVHVAVPTVTRLEQRYRRLPGEGPGHRFDYESPEFDFRTTLVYDAAGLIVDYPGIAVRAT